MSCRLILASASPRRRQLLTEAGYDFEVDPSDVEEPEPGPERRRPDLRRAARLEEGGGGRPAARGRADPGRRHRLCASTARSSTSRSTGPTPSG